MYFTSVAAAPSRLHNSPGSHSNHMQAQQPYGSPNRPRGVMHHHQQQQQPAPASQVQSNSLLSALGLLSGHHQLQPDGEHGDSTPPQINVVLRRHSADVPWGFRLQGGSDYNLELMISKTQNGSPSEGVLHQGDSILSINGESSRHFSHDEASNKIKSSGTDLQLTISRRQGDCLDLKPRGQLKFNAPNPSRT